MWNRQMVHGEQLKATIYDFRSDNDALIALTRLSLRDSRSLTIQTSVDRAAENSFNVIGFVLFHNINKTHMKSF